MKGWKEKNEKESNQYVVGNEYVNGKSDWMW